DRESRPRRRNTGNFPRAHVPPWTALASKTIIVSRGDSPRKRAEPTRREPSDGKNPPFPDFQHTEKSASRRISPYNSPPWRSSHFRIERNLKIPAYPRRLKSHVLEAKSACRSKLVLP